MEWSSESKSDTTVLLAPHGLPLAVAWGVPGAASAEYLVYVDEVFPSCCPVPTLSTQNHRLRKFFA